VDEMEGAKRFQLSFQGSLSESNGQIAQPAALQTFGTAEASLVSPLPNLGRADAQVQQASQQLTAYQAQLRSAELDVEFKATQAFIELLRAREAESIAEDNFAQSTRQAADTQRRIDAGDVPAADLLKAQVPVAQNKAALARAKIAVLLATQNINDILQRELSSPLDLAQPPPFSRLALNTQSAVTYALAHSPDCLQAEADVEAAKANVRFVRHARDLDLSLQLTHTRTSDITADTYLTTFGLTVGFPLIDGGVAVQQMKQALSQQAQSETALKQTRQHVRLSVEQAMLDVEGDEADAEATSATEEIARQSLEKARQSYEAGLTTTRDVLDALLVYSQARVEASSARYDLALAWAHLKQVMGGSLP